MSANKGNCPVLFIHGAFATNSIWAKFIPLFKQAGYECFAPTLFPELRTHRHPPKALSKMSLQDMVDEATGLVHEITDDTGQKPIIIGHSMGGLISQKLTESGLSAKSVFITPAAPADCFNEGIQMGLSFIGEMKLKRPGFSYKIDDLTLDFAALNKIPEKERRAIHKTMVYESGLALENIVNPYADENKTGIIDERKINVPNLTIGAFHDRTCIIPLVRKIGEKYSRTGGEYIEYPNNAHMITIESNAEDVAGDIINWLAKMA